MRVAVRHVDRVGYMAGLDRGRTVAGVDDHRRHALLLALAEVLSPYLTGASSYRLARAVAMGVLDEGPGTLTDPDDEQWAAEGLSQVSETRVTFWAEELHRLSLRGVWMTDVRDASYPANLVMVHNQPPFLLVRGTLAPLDSRAVAVVGTRHPSPKGNDASTRIAAELAKRNITVVSGLALGIDSQAHRGALSAGGRTIAVFGTGIERVYPAKNRELADEVAKSGACVSQFWPTTAGAKWTFPARNLVTSGISVGTVVVEAGETSGARLQAEAALKHGKRVFLLRSLVDAQPWARAIVDRPGAVAVDSVDEVIRAVDAELPLPVS